MHPYRPLTLAAALFVGGLSPAFAQSGTEPSSSPSPSSSDSTASSSPSPSSGTELSSAGSGAGEAGAGLKQKQNGIAVQLSLVTRMPFVQSSGTAANLTTGISGDMFAGYKLDRFLFGLGFGIDHNATTTTLASPSGSSTTNTQTTSFLISPGLQVAALRAASGRLELIGAVQFGFGKAVTSRSDNPTLPTPVVAQYPTDNFHLKYQIGPGLRFFFIPQFALTLLSGIEGDHFFATQDAPSGLRADNLATVSVFGKLGLLGVF